MNNAVAKWLSTSGPGSLIGAVVGWILWGGLSTRPSDCGFGQTCAETATLFGVTFSSFYEMAFTGAVIGGLLGIGWMFIKD